jgi:hypothetical protein
MQVTVAMAVYNGRETLTAALQSVASQSYRDFQICARRSKAIRFPLESDQVSARKRSRFFGLKSVGSAFPRPGTSKMMSAKETFEYAKSKRGTSAAIRARFNGP